MKNRTGILFLCISIWFFGFLTGLFIGRNYTKEAVLISIPPQMLTAPTAAAETESTPNFPLDINTASKAELMALPKIGETLAFRIVSYRRERGPFPSKYDLLKVDGLTETIFEEIEDLICIGG